MDPSHQGKILLIDDDKDTRDVYKEILEEAGFKLDLAENGEEGYAKILQGGYDLILLDIMMPKIDGIAILENLKKKPPQVYNGPIIVLSQLNQPDIINTAMELGAKDYFVKSDLTPDQLLEKVSQSLQTPTKS
ncbi:response regulator [Candidatus Daviesbacteria bacterium]|nr:response regulator [Candidatus Daviesbacteria bacterium]